MWEPAVVTGPHIQPRFFLVQSQHGQLRRNRRHLYKTNEAPPLFASIDLTAAVRHTPRASIVSPEQPRDVPAAPPEPVNTQDYAVGSRSFYQKWSYGQDSGKIPMNFLVPKYSGNLTANYLVPKDSGNLTANYLVPKDSGNLTVNNLV